MKKYTETELLQIYAAFIEAHQINIAEEYEQWLNVAFACASVGDDGKEAFEIISRQSNKYKTNSNRQKWRNALKTGRADGIGYIVNSLKKLGVETAAIIKWFETESGSNLPAPLSSPDTKKKSLTNANAQKSIDAKQEPKGAKAGRESEASSKPSGARQQKKGGKTQIDLSQVPQINIIKETLDTKEDAGEPYKAEQEQQRAAKYNDATKRVVEALDKFAPLRVISALCEDDEQKVAALWGFVAGCSAIAKNTYIKYDGRTQHIHIYYMLCAPAASGKGILSDIREAFSGIQDAARLRARANWETYKDLYNKTPKDKRELIPKPKAPTFWLPADTSTSALISAIRDNDGSGCIWESEIDTINRAIKSDYGNYTDTLRNNYHGEYITYLRKTGREYIQLNNTHFAAVIAGTMGQVETFFKSTENGLFSRWAFGSLSGGAEWANKFVIRDKTPQINNLCQIVSQVERSNDISSEITFSRDQQQQHYKYYTAKQSELLDTLGGAAVSFLRRQALTQLRAAAVLHTMTGNNNGQCNTLAWDLAAAMAAHSVECGGYIIARLPESDKPAKRKEIRAAQIFDTLPDLFSAQDVPSDTSRATYYRYIQEWQQAGKIVREGKQWRKCGSIESPK